ncbi:disks large homolog 5-like [Lytechinus pictus]|uniref:disks large homolog 5-like n=1 Tax=Lytechinus pictus TaxID=7653 RepID=UPI0030B9BA9B
MAFENSTLVYQRRAEMFDSDSDHLSSSGESSPREGIGKSIVIPNFGAVQHNPNKRIPLMGTWRLHESVNISRSRQNSERSSGVDSDADFVFRHKSNGIDARYSAVRRLPVNGHCEGDYEKDRNGDRSHMPVPERRKEHLNGHCGLDLKKFDVNGTAVRPDPHLTNGNRKEYSILNGNNVYINATTTVGEWLENGHFDTGGNNGKKPTVGYSKKNPILSINNNVIKEDFHANGKVNFNQDSDESSPIFIQSLKLDDNLNRGIASLLYSNTPSLTFCQRKRLNFMKLCLRRNQPFYFLEMAGENDKVPSPRMLMPRPNSAFIPRMVPGTGSKEHGVSVQSSLDSDNEDVFKQVVNMHPSDQSLADRGIPNRKLQARYQEAMLKLETLKRQNEETLKMYDQARKDADYYCKQHRTAMSNGDQLRGKLQGLQQEYAELMSERNQVQQEINDLRQRYDDDAKELNELRIQSREFVSVMGQPDVKRMYDMAMDRYETLKHEYDSLQKRYTDMKSSHGSGVNKIERLQEDKSQLQLQIDTAVKERNALKQQCTGAIREYEKARRELEELRKQEYKAQQDSRVFKQAIKKAQMDRDQAVHEHRLVMSERDEVHKEIEKLQDEAQRESTRRKAAEEKLATMQNDYSHLHQKLVDTLREQDQSEKKISDLSERYRVMINNTMMAKKEREGILQDLRKYEEELQVARHERKEALDQLEEVNQERYKAKQEQEMTNHEYKEVNKEVESLRRKVDSLTRELKESVQESENAKRLRDWAFMERDKIVAERESIRALCDKLRRERDRAVSNYAEALRKTDDVERKKNEVTKELNEVKQNVIQQEEKEARMRQLIAPRSRDSAIDADSQEWQMELVEIETVKDDGDMTMLGFDIGDCNKDHQFPDDCSVVITKVDKGSVADGRLKVNDCVVRVNNVDLTNGGDRSIAVQALQAVKNSRGVLNMVVKRRRPSSVRHHPVKLFYGGKEHGLVLDNGIFISRIVAGSAAAKEGSLLPGDRIVYVDGFLVENKSVSEVEEMLSSSNDSVMLNIVRVTGMSMSSSTSPTVESIQSHETSSSKSSLTPYLPPMEVPEQKSDRNGNLQQPPSAKDEVVQQALRAFVQRRESMHSRESSHESANSGEQTPLALSRQNSVKEKMHNQDPNRDKRLTVGDYPQNSLKRSEIGQRESRKSYSGREIMPLEFGHPNGQYDLMRHVGGEFVKSPSPGVVIHHENYRRDGNLRSYHGNDSSHRPQDSGRRDVAHVSEIKNDGQPLTNGDLRPLPGSREGQGKNRTFPREGTRESHFNDDFPPVQFDRTDPHRESIHNRNASKSLNRKREFNGWSEPSRSLYPSRMPNHKPSYESSHWEECKNESVHSSHVNGNVQVSRSISQNCSPRDFHASSPHMQQPVQSGHIRSWSSSSGRDMEPNFKPEEYVSCHLDSDQEDSYPDWDQKQAQNNVFAGDAESKTVPVTHPKQQVHVKDHSTWPRSHGPPDPYNKGHKKRRRGPIPDMTQRNDSVEAIIKPTPPSRTSSFKASLRHVEPSPTSPNGSESRRQSSSAGSEMKSQGSLHSTQSTTVKVSPINPSSPLNNMRQNNINQNGIDSPKQNGFFQFDSHPEHSKLFVSMTKDVTQAVAFRPVSVPSVQQIKYLPSESAIVPRVEPLVHATSPGYYSSRRPPEPFQNVRADPVVTVPPWDTSSLRSESGSSNHYNTWSRPAEAQVIIQPTVPSYKVISRKLESAITNNRYIQDSPNYQPPSPGLSDFDPFPMYPREPITLSRTSLPGSGRGHQMSLSTSSEYSTTSLPTKFNRIHFTPNPPSRPSPGPSSSSDIASINSGHSSPTSPSVIDDSPYLSPAVSVEPSVTVTSQGGPNDTRLIEIEKTLEPGLGFSIKEAGGIFVNTVTEGSLAYRGGLKYGDQILEVNGINLRRATYENAVQILTRAGNSICIKVQYNRNKMEDDQRSSMCSSTQSTPIASQTSTRTNSPTPTITPPTPRASRTQSILSSSSSVMLSEQPRFVFLTKCGGSIGIRMYGGNKVGIFVSEIEPMSPASKSDGLLVGDQILEYNGVDLRNATAEKAAIELQKPAEGITILAQHNLSKFNKIQNHNCDELYIKALTDFTAEKEGQLSFKKEEVMIVEDTMYNGSLGVWIAWLINQEGKKSRGAGGQIPSKTALHREMVRRRLLSEGMQEEELRTASSRRSSGPARRSFLKRKKKHQHNNSKDSRELSEGSMTDVPVHEDASVPTYLRVEPLDMHIKRPVILLGPLVDKVALKMTEESPNKYVRVYPKIVQSASHMLEKDVENGLILDYQRKDGMYEVINTSDVKDICKKGCHCILNGLNPYVAERLQRLQLHPIVIFVKFKTIKNIKEQKDPHFLRERVTHKQAKELLEAANKIEQDFKSLFSEIIQGGNLASISTRVKNLIDTQQRKPIWIPSSQPL